MKECKKCKIEKEDKDFYTQSDRKSGTSMCKSCFNEYCVLRWINTKIKALEYKGNKCQDCNNEYPEKPYVIFDFHHLDPNLKDYSWNQLRLMSWKSIIKELDKCVLLCSNCHKIRHHNEYCSIQLS